jgi:hypothetical protein
MECQLKSSVSESNLWPLLIDRPLRKGHWKKKNEAEEEREEDENGVPSGWCRFICEWVFEMKSRRVLQEPLR